VIRFSMRDLPPKKDGASSMWRKAAELGRLKALRREASRAMGGRPLLTGRVELTIEVYADEKAGDLDNLITGVCDGLQAAHPLTPIDESEWLDVPREARPHRAIVFADDSVIAAIHATRKAPADGQPRYEVSVVGQ